MASSSTARTASVSRPPVKRAHYTWPGTTASRNHFEDFLREIGGNNESARLCCVPHSATTHPHVHMSQRSSSHIRSKARSSPSRAQDKSRTSSQDASSKAPARSPSRPENRGRTLSRPQVSGTLTSGLPVSLKSPALSSIDLENHDAAGTIYNYFSAARDSLLSFMGSLPVDERPSRPTFWSSSTSQSPPSRSPDSHASSRPSSTTSPREIFRHSEPRSRARSSARTRDRSSSRSPSIDSLDTASSSEAPATPRTHSGLAHELLPTLEELERASRFRVPCVCMTCKRAGSNFPHCAKCGEAWCSRECRTGAAGTHACHGRTVSAA